MTMTVPLWCLLGFATWTLLLVLGVVSWRSVMVLRGDKRANEFMAGVPHGPDLYWRLNRAHLNAVENLPLLGAVIFVATHAQVDTPLFSLLCEVHLAARVCQTTAHLASNAVGVVYVRFTSLVTQVVCLAAMIVEIARHAT
jgi:uncharacterized MAPEG superfamily protein